MNITQNTQDLQQGLNQEILLHRMTNRIRQSLELEEILTATVGEIRSFLGTERVIIHRFQADGSGEVIAESLEPNCLPSLLGLKFPSDDIPIQSRELFVKTRQRSIVNVVDRLIGLSPVDSIETGEPLSTVDIHYRMADPCHIEYLKAMGLKCSMVVPIIHQQQLWGLLVSHATKYQIVTLAQLQLVQRIADQVSLAIAQSTLLSLAREQAYREATINRVATLLHAQPTVELQAALEETVTVLGGIGGRLYITTDNPNQPDQLYICGTQPILINQESTQQPFPIPIEEHPVWQQLIEASLKETPKESVSSGSNLCAIADLYQETYLQELVPAFQPTEIRGLLIVALNYRQQRFGYLTIFRQEVNIETLWAGRFDPNKQQVQPRKSFTKWRELKVGQPQPWTSTEIEISQALGNHFAMAIGQHQLYQQVHNLNANLERQVKERTDKLEQSLELARVLKQVTDQIRSTLNLPTILQTIVREVNNLLNTDRVVIYQFINQFSGKVVVEQVKNAQLSILEEIYEDNCFPLEYTYQYKCGRVRAVENVEQSELQSCHKDFLRSIEVKANLVVPIRMGEKLWGLLIAHECHHPRVWQAAEIDLLQQLADQAAIAIQQAELYEQSCIAAKTATAQAQQIQQASEQQKALFCVISKIRETLNLDTIFQATARELRSLLNVDRVGVFRFDPLFSFETGKFVSEDVLPGFSHILGMTVSDHCFKENYVEKYQQGRIQAIDDIYRSGLSDCHIKILAEFEIRANLIAPLMKSGNLWGLLCIHQCSGPHHWEESEIEFVTQIAAQLGVALQQAELLAQTKEQAEQLTETIRDLQETQTQLIQTEKMSSLGQLVAGIAHEINNPVNFIYGNLTHVDNYAQDLLNLIDIYDKHCPDPSPEIIKEKDMIDLEFLANDLPKILNSMKVGADRIRQLVLSLRNFSRLDQADRKPVDIHEGIDSTILILQHRLKPKQSSVGINIVKFYGELPPVECYAGPLNQVFMNVLSNAIDALEQRDSDRTSEEIQALPSEITIRTSIVHDDQDRLPRVLIQIADNGPGIPQEVKAQIFDPFFTTKPVGKGTGLGLSISYQIVVEKHNGIFKCHSQPGKGTEFIIEIPF